MKSINGPGIYLKPGTRALKRAYPLVMENGG